MTAPTLPDRDAISDAGLKRARASSAASSEAYEYLEEIKADMVLFLPNTYIKSLMKHSVTVLALNQDFYAFPTEMCLLPDFELLTMSVLKGIITGTFLAGSTTSSLNLSADAITDVTLYERNRILVTANTGVGGIGTITNIETGPNVASVIPSLNNGAPDATSKYLIVNEIVPLEIKDASFLTAEAQNAAVDTPTTAYVSVANDGTGKLFRLRPSPDVLYGIELIHAVDITEIDLAGTLISTLYQKYRSLWIQGIVWRRMADDGDGGYIPERTKYEQMLSSFVEKESIR